MDEAGWAVRLTQNEKKFNHHRMLILFCRLSGGNSVESVVRATLIFEHRIELSGLGAMSKKAHIEKVRIQTSNDR